MTTELVPIGQRVGALLLAKGGSGTWLAKRAGVDRATVKRVLDGTRHPSLETLTLFATVFDMTVEELVDGTDAVGRVVDAKRVVAREHYDEAVKECLAARNEAMDLKQKARELEHRLTGEEARRNREQRGREDAEKANAHLRTELAAARDSGRVYAEQAEHFRLAFLRAQKETAALQAKLAELSEEVRSGKRTGQVALGMASVAAAAALANLFKEETK